MASEGLIAEFDAVIAGASRKDQWNAVNRAIELRAKLKGFLIDRVEIGGPNEFSRCETAEWVFALLADNMIADAGSVAGALADLDEIRSAIFARGAEMPKTVS